MADPKATPKTSKYVTLSPITHNNRYYFTGRPIQLTDEEAELFLTAKAVKAAK